jgi:hypothetical protein
MSDDDAECWVEIPRCGGRWTEDDLARLRELGVAVLEIGTGASEDEPPDEPRMLQ